MSGKKLCPTCNTEKHVLEFPSSKKYEDGLWYECRKCYSERDARNRKIRETRIKKPPKFYDVTYPTKD